MKKKRRGKNSGVASPIYLEGQSERNFPIFAFSSRFFLFFPELVPKFSWFFPDFSQFLATFSLSGVAHCPLATPVATTLGKKKKEERMKSKRRKKKRQKLRNLNGKSMVIMVMINLNQAKLMNEKNWVENWTTVMRKNVKKKRRRRKVKNSKGNRWIGNGRKERRGMKSSIERKGGKCQGILSKLSQWCNWDMKRKRRVRKKKINEKGGKKEKGAEIQKKEKQLMINLMKPS